MSDLAIYENMASAALHRCRSEIYTRKILRDFEGQLLLAPTEEAREGLKLVIRKLDEHLRAKWPNLPLEPRERYP